VQTDAVTLAEVRTNNGQSLLAVNDILIGRRDPISARYTIAYGGRRERQSSSGVLVCTGVGSTGWMRSVVTGAMGIAARAHGDFGAAAGDEDTEIPFEWYARYLLFAVREPFPSRYTGTELIFGPINEGDSPVDELVLESEMPEDGVIFSDGVVEDAIAFTSGTTATIRVADVSARLVKPIV
jgi:hypothetical protein